MQQVAGGEGGKWRLAARRDAPIMEMAGLLAPPPVRVAAALLLFLIFFLRCTTWDLRLGLEVKQDGKRGDQGVETVFIICAFGKNLTGRGRG